MKEGFDLKAGQTQHGNKIERREREEPSGPSMPGSKCGVGAGKKDGDVGGRRREQRPPA